MSTQKPGGITLETRQQHIECMVCNEQASADCQDLARAFANHFTEPRGATQHEALLRRVNGVDEWTVCDHCQKVLSGEDKVRLMTLWMVLEGMRNWLRTEMRVGLTPALPLHPPIQLA